jgi:hypothetical protein
MERMNILPAATFEGDVDDSIVLLLLPRLREPEIRSMIFRLQPNNILFLEVHKEGVIEGFECCEVEFKGGVEVPDGEGGVVDWHFEGCCRLGLWGALGW